MPFSPAAQDDIWYRCLIKPNEQPDEAGRFKNMENAFAQPREERPWLLECSGRVASLGPDFRLHAENTSRSENARLSASNALRGRGQVTNRQYRGRWIGSVRDIRGVPGLDVYLEDIEEDPAHANLVVTSGDFVSAGKIAAEAVDALRVVLAVEDP